MNANEIMVGNYVLVVEHDYTETDEPIIKQTVEKIHSIPNNLESDYLFGVPCNEDGCNVEPISLTEEWLLKFGFFFQKDTSRWLIGKLKAPNWTYDMSMIMVKENEIYLDYNGRRGIKLNSVHQLQNLYFALTGEQLVMVESIKP